VMAAQGILASGLAMYTNCPWTLSIFLFIAGFLPFVGAIACGQVYLVGYLGLTTNEYMCRDRYTYLQDEHGNFVNPFNKGIRGNCAELFFPQVTSVDVT